MLQGFMIKFVHDMDSLAMHKVVRAIYAEYMNSHAR